MTALPGLEALEFDGNEEITSHIVGGSEKAVAAANQMMADVQGFQASMSAGDGLSGPGSFVAALAAERSANTGHSL